MISKSPENHQIPVYTSIKTDPGYLINATNTDTQKLDADKKEFLEIAKKMTTKVTKLINAQMNLSVQTVEKNTWQGVRHVKRNNKKKVLQKKLKLIAEW